MTTVTSAYSGERSNNGSAPGAGTGPDPLALVELRNPPAELARHMVERLEAGDVLDAFLLAAGLRQIAEDRLEDDGIYLAATHRVLTQHGHRRMAAVVGSASYGENLVRAAAPWRRPLRGWDLRLGPLVNALADAVAGSSAADTGRLAERARELLWELPTTRGFRDDVLRIPSCFRGIDQHPDDVRRLVDKLAAGLPGRDAPIAVVGVRTSGSYLAPLAAAHLRARGYRATALSARPSHPLSRGKCRLLRSVARAGGTVAVIDDPPASGDSIARVAAVAERLGARRDSVVVLCPRQAGDRGTPRAIAPYRTVELAWDEWSLQDRLKPEAVAESLARLWPDTQVLDVAPCPLDDAPSRGHVTRRYRVSIGTSEGVGRRDVVARGVGVGYFGAHSLAVARRLSAHVPEVHGVVDGLLFRDWLPEEQRIDAPGRRAEAAARYAAARRRELPVTSDPTVRMGGQDPVWEVAANLTSRAFARAWRPMRVLAVDRVMRELLAVEHPSVVDGATAAGGWFEAGPGQPAVKTNPDDRAFSNRNLACYDAAYDVAAAPATEDLDENALLEEFARASGGAIDHERWFLYRLVALWAARRDGLLDVETAKRASARALARYFAAIYLDDLSRAEDGPLCALDIDGVLETDTLGFSGTSPAGALALRALIAHGYRPLLASGRSLQDVADRCDAYGLAGGVAEYGAALYRAGAGATALLGADHAAAVGAARAALSELPRIQLAADHLHVVRAFRRDENGRRGPLDDHALELALSAAPPGRLRAAVGDDQTDLIPTGVDKGTGLRALVGGAPLALAVGDGAEDVPMLALARNWVAVQNADPTMRRAGARRMRAPYQSGLAQAVGELIGHPPGGCPACCPPARPRAERLLAILGAREAGKLALAGRAARLVLVGGRRDAGS